jgi:nucleotide-binding universal stress UspA family protein
VEDSMYKKILVPLDGSSNDDIVLDHVKKLAKQFGSTVTLILLFRLAPADDPFEKDMQMEDGSSGWRAKGRAEKYLPELQKALADDGIEANTEFLVVEQPEPDAIVKYADDNNFDLIVFANRERSPIGRFFFGNVEEKVRRRTSLPVLFVSERKK